METRELHNLVPATPQKKKKTRTVREKHRETGPPTIQVERATNHEAGTPDTLHQRAKKKKSKEAGHLKKPLGKAHTHAPSPKRQRVTEGRGLGLDGKNNTQ